MKEFERNLIFTDADQDIYTKIPNVIFTLKNKGEDLFPTIIPWAGGFLIGKYMLCTIHSFFER